MSIAPIISLIITPTVHYNNAFRERNVTACDVTIDTDVVRRRVGVRMKA